MSSTIKSVRFADLKVGDRIVRVEGYKVESAKIMKIEKLDKKKLCIIVKTSETNKKVTFTIDGTSTMFGLMTSERYYADFGLIEGLRDGISIGVEYARKMMNASFNEMIPYFTCAGRPVDDTEAFNKLMAENREDS
jgi:hypothetical protein